MKQKNDKTLAILLCGAAVLAQGNLSAVDIPTSLGDGADTYLTNDGDSGPDNARGGDGGMNLRFWNEVRSRQLLLRFDVSQLESGADFSDSVLSLTFTVSNRSRTIQVFGLVDESLDEWDEATTAYANAPGAIFDPDNNVLGTFEYDIFDPSTNPNGVWEELGTFDVNDRGEPFTDTSVPSALPLEDFLAADTNGVVSFLVVWGGDNAPSWWLASKEDGVVSPPTLTVPNAGAADSDGDGLADVWEEEFFGNNDGVITTEELALQSGTDDFDEDGFDNAAEFVGESDPTDPLSIPGDVDGDGLADLWEDEHFGNNDGDPTSAELALQDALGDPDEDLNLNSDEETNGTDPNDFLSFLDDENGDGTGDGLNDFWEVVFFGDTTTVSDPSGDFDGDNATNEEEYLAFSDPADPASVPGDIDGDGLSDLWEDEHFGNNDGIVTVDELAIAGPDEDPDEDTFTNADEESSTPVASDPNDPASVPGDADGDGLSDSWELSFFATILDQDGDDDSDGDLYTNAEEFAASTDPDDLFSFPDDSDNDGLNDRWELQFFGDLTTAEDPFGDTDGDGELNIDEYEFGSDPTNPDSVFGDIDGDGLDDDWEIGFFGDIFLHGADDDPDRDFSTNLEEFDANTDPTNRMIFPDSDFDGLGDGWETTFFGDTEFTNDPAADPDGDGFTNEQEFAAATDGNDPLSTPDEDGDRLPDGWELAFFINEGEDPEADRETILARQSGEDDFDGDGVSNLLESIAGTDPSDSASAPNPVTVSTAFGDGADTMLSNDNQNAGSLPTVVHGADEGLEARDNRASRLKIPMFRFDVSQLGGDLSTAVLQVTTTFGSPESAGDLEVFGLVDGDPGERWDESTTNYNNAPGILESELAVFNRDPQRYRLLGTINVQPTGDNISTPDVLDLGSFLEEDTDGVVTIILRAPGNRWYGLVTKEGDPDAAPTLIAPNGEVVEPAAPLRVTEVALDQTADQFSMTVSGLTVGESYHLEVSADLSGFTALGGSTFVAAAETQEVVTAADASVEPRRFLRVVEGAEP